MKIVLRLAFVLLVVVPLLAWFLVKPVRVIAPQAFGMLCSDGVVCVESADQSPQAVALYSEALQFVRAHVGPLKGKPVVVFCTTQPCADHYGLGDRSAVTLGTIGTVIGPKAWKNYYVRHELIHQLQGQQFGVLRRLALPGWFVEGMAYGLSGDPRPTLAEPWQADRSQFNAWLARVGRENIWTAERD